MGNGNSKRQSYIAISKDPFFSGQKLQKDELIKRLQKMASEGDLLAAGGVGKIKQWVKAVPNFSSQYDSHNWGACQVVGPPKVYPKYGDIHGAWAPKLIDGSQFLELEFEQALFPTALNIYETYHAGGVKAVMALTDSGKWKTVWKNNRPENLNQSRIFSPPIAELGCRTNKIRLEIDCTACGTWVEIDAVEMEGTRFLTAPPPSMSDLSRDFEQMVNNDQFSDVQFLIESKKVHAHKAILCARSDYFRAMFSNQMKETFMTAPLEIVDVGYDSFLALLHFLYTNKIPDSYDSLKLTDLWRVADKFSMEGLKLLTTFLISEKINEDNVVDTYVAATNSFPIIEEVRGNCMTYMSSNMNKVVNTTSFSRLPQETMLEIIQGATAKLSL